MSTPAPHPFPTGRRLPTDQRHIEKYPYLAPPAPITVERVLPRPSTAMRRYMDQGVEGSCVGWGWSWALAFIHATVSAAGRAPVMPRFDARWLYQQAQLVDEYADTPPAEGTSVRAGGDVLRAQGHVRCLRGKDQPCDPTFGILSNRWATSVDQMRAALARGLPLVVGTDWHEGMDRPVKRGREFWLPAPSGLGRIRGGHCWCIFGASDQRQAFLMTNSWGLSFPLCWVPYPLMDFLLQHDGEAALITPR